MNRSRLVRRLAAVIAVATGIALVPFMAPAQAGTSQASTTMIHFPKVFISILRGANEVDGGDPNGLAIAAAILDPNNGKLCYLLAERNLQGGVTLAHIHQGAAGVNGPVVVQLVAPVQGFSHECITIDPTLAESIVDNPRGFYFNIHTTAFKGGAVRGQLR